MRQLTGLDAEFLALETPRQTGHVEALAVLDPGARPNGRLELTDLHNMIAERLPLLPLLRAEQIARIIGRSLDRARPLCPERPPARAVRRPPASRSAAEPATRPAPARTPGRQPWLTRERRTRIRTGTRRPHDPREGSPPGRACPALALGSSRYLPEGRAPGRRSGLAPAGAGES